MVSTVSVCALALPLAACGSSGDNATGGNARTTVAGTRAVAAGTESVDAFLSRVESGLGRSGSAHLQLTATGNMPGTAQGDVSYGAAGLTARITATAPILGDAAATVIVVGHTVYASVPGLTPPGKFLRIEPQSLGGPSLGRHGSALPLDPSDLLGGLRAGVTGVEVVGTEQVGGASLDHYRVHVSPAKAAAAMRSLFGSAPAGGLGRGMDHGMPRSMGTGSGGGGGSMTGSLPKSVVADVWLDSQDHVRQVRADLGGTKVQVQLSRWGEPVDVQAPPADDVVEMPKPMGIGNPAS